MCIAYGPRLEGAEEAVKAVPRFGMTVTHADGLASGRSAEAIMSFV